MTIKMLNQQYRSCHGEALEPHGHAAAHVSMSDTATDFAAICDNIAAQLYGSHINTGEIPRDLYEATATKLMDAVFSGTGGKRSYAYEDPNNLLVAHLRQNIYAFSAAKSLTEIQVFNDMLIGADGKKKEWVQYRNDLTKAGYVFNNAHLETDYITAEASAQTAQTFNEFKDDELIQVSTTGDERVCDICGGFDGFTRPKSATIWWTLCPPFHQRCKCKLIPGTAHNVKKHTNGRKLLQQQKVPAYFQQNPALSKVIYTDGYPHMQQIKNPKELKWDTAYNMPPVERIYNSHLPDALPPMTKEQAGQWWTTQAGTKTGSIFKKDNFGTVVKLEKSNRFAIVHNLDDILKQPDEVWSIKDKNGKLRTTYIKYYNDMPYNVQVLDNVVVGIGKYEGGVGEIDAKSLNQDRSGILLFRK